MATAGYPWYTARVVGISWLAAMRACVWPHECSYRVRQSLTAVCTIQCEYDKQHTNFGRRELSKSCMCGSDSERGVSVYRCLTFRRGDTAFWQTRLLHTAGITHGKILGYVNCRLCRLVILITLSLLSSRRPGPSNASPSSTSAHTDDNKRRTKICYFFAAVLSQYWPCFHTLC